MLLTMVIYYFIDYVQQTLMSHPLRCDDFYPWKFAILEVLTCSWTEKEDTGVCIQHTNKKFI